MPKFRRHLLFACLGMAFTIKYFFMTPDIFFGVVWLLIFLGNAWQAYHHSKD